MEATLQLHSLKLNDAKTYMAAALFAAGNIVLPQLAHLVPQGGITWLPIYFFTLIAAYKYGWSVGLLTAIVSPIANSLLFGMPVMGALPAILVKSVILASFAAIAAKRFKKASLPLIAGVVIAYQLVGTLFEWAVTGNLAIACQDLHIGIPGMLLQIVGGWTIINLALRK